jgi:TPR repeat protein
MRCVLNKQPDRLKAMAVAFFMFISLAPVANIAAAAQATKPGQSMTLPKTAPQDPDKAAMLQAEQFYGQKKFTEAGNILLPLAQKGNANAAFSLGLMEARGNFGKPDYVKARAWWEKSAQKGHSEAEYNLGLVYYRGVQNGGDGTDPARRDFAKALEWWNKAAAHGHTIAMYSLAGMASTGEGQPKNMQLAADWYAKAAELGHPEAQYQLGSMYLNGAGVEKNLAEAKKWMQKAANAGHPGAISAIKMLNSPKSNSK